MITKENYENNICEDYYCPNSKFCTTGIYSNKNSGLFNVSINEENKINLKSLDLPLGNVTGRKDKKHLIHIANKIILCKKNEINIINENVVSFITLRSPGSGHGFGDIFDCLFRYFDNINEYSNLKIILYKDATQGILDIVRHLGNINLIDKNKFIYLEDNKIYKFKSVTFLNNFKLKALHLPYHDNLFNSMQELLSKYYIDKVKYLPTKYKLDNILLIKDKALKSIRDSTDGFDLNDINNFCEKFNYTRILPEELNEVELINILNNCKKLAISWGTAHWKNIPYISDKCNKINVFVKGKYYKDEYSSYLNCYNNYVSSDKTLQRTNALKNWFDPPRAKYHVVENLSEIESL